MQTATSKMSSKQIGLVGNTIVIIKKQGVLALYNGLTASLLRQLTYSTTRFGIYEVAKQSLNKTGEVPFYQTVFLAGFSGAAGGLIGTPADMVNVRMQNDIKLPLEQRRNYKHALDGLFKVYKHEGVGCLFNGATMATSRAVFMTIGQVNQSNYINFNSLFFFLFFSLISFQCMINSSICCCITFPICFKTIC